MENNLTGAAPVTSAAEDNIVDETRALVTSGMQVECFLSPFKRFKVGQLMALKDHYMMCTKGFQGDREMMLDRALKLNRLLGAITLKQAADVKAIGFGGILLLRMPEMTLWLDNEGNTLRRLFHALGQKFRPRYTASTIERDLGLTWNPYRPVVKDLQSPHVQAMLASWKTSHSVSFGENFNLEELEAAILRLEGGGPDFQRMFIVYVLHTFLCPGHGLDSVVGVLNSMMNVEDIKDLDWASLVCDSFHQSHKAATLTWKRGGCEACAQLLLMFFFHRYCYATHRSPDIETRCDVAKLSLNQGDE